MGVLKGFLFFCAAAFALGGLLPAYLFGPGVVTLIVAALGLGLGWAVFAQARKFGVQSVESQKVQFEQTARRLAEKSNGHASLEAIVHATGAERAEAEAKMKALMGRGIFELDFGPNGEVLYKLTPMDEARASLARLSEKNPS